MSDPWPPETLGGPPARKGTLHIVGGGPGDPAQLTLRAAVLLSTCDVVAYDHLSPAEALELVPAAADRILVGRRRGRPGYAREELDDLLLARASAGDAVVRLKGGDPFVFGRGGEEALAARDAGVPCEIVSGVSSPVAVPAAAGIPVTHRRLSRGFAVVTGHEAGGEASSADPAALAAFPGTLVLLMGLARARSLVERLIANGRAPDTPAAVVSAGTLPEQRSVVAELAEIADVAEAEGLPAPAVIVVGEAVSLSSEISGREARPLHGLRVAVPRTRSEPDGLAAGLRHAGARVTTPELVERLGPDEAALARLAHEVLDRRVERLVVRDPSGMEHLRRALIEAGGDLRALHAVRVEAADAQTAAAVAERVGIRPDAPGAPDAVAAPRTVVLAPDEDAPRPGGPRHLAVTRLRPRAGALGEPDPIDAADAVVVTNAGLVPGIAPVLGERSTPLVALGRETGRALEDVGLPVAVEAEPTLEATVAALRRLGSASDPRRASARTAR